MVAIKVMPAGLEGGQPKQVALGRRPTTAAIKAKGTSTTAGLIPLLLSTTMRVLMKPRHGAGPP